MSDNLYEIDEQAELDAEQSTKSKVITYAMMALGVLVGLFVVFWLMFRVNYKINAVRNEFWPTLKWIFIAAVVFFIGVFIVMFVINLVGKKGAYDKNFVKEKEESKK